MNTVETLSKSYIVYKRVVSNILLSLCLLFLAPLTVGAQDNLPGNADGSIPGSSAGGSGGGSKGISYEVTDFTGFLKMAETTGQDPLTLLVVGILEIIIVLAIPIIVLFIIYAGFLYVTARGNSQQVEQATRAFTYAVIGAILVIGAVAIAGILQGVVSALGS